MFGKTKCKECGMTLESDKAIKNLGSLFCSEECATEYDTLAMEKLSSCWWLSCSDECESTEHDTKKSEDRHGCCC